MYNIPLRHSPSRNRYSDIMQAIKGYIHFIFVAMLHNSILYKLLFSRGFFFHEFREPDPRENFHFNSCLFIVMTTSEKS